MERPPSPASLPKSLARDFSSRIRTSSRKGTVVKEKVKCGDDSCHCASGNPQAMHGPYLYRYYREDGTMTSEYIGKP